MEAVMDDYIKKPRFCRAIRLHDVCDRTAFSPATVWRKVKHDADFPKPFHLSTAITCWDEGEILDWIESRKAERGAK
jgi:predicted DNA-binding transcriptional regulator AlpA